MSGQELFGGRAALLARRSPRRLSSRMTLEPPDAARLGEFVEIMRFPARTSAPRAANVILLDISDLLGVPPLRSGAG